MSTILFKTLALSVTLALAGTCNHLDAELSKLSQKLVKAMDYIRVHENTLLILYKQYLKYECRLDRESIVPLIETAKDLVYQKYWIYQYLPFLSWWQPNPDSTSLAFITAVGHCDAIHTMLRYFKGVIKELEPFFFTRNDPNPEGLALTVALFSEGRLRESIRTIERNMDELLCNASSDEKTIFFLQDVNRVLQQYKQDFEERSMRPISNWQNMVISCVPKGDISLLKTPGTHSMIDAEAIATIRCLEHKYNLQKQLQP